MKIAIIIPALNPDERLIKYVDTLIKAGQEDILIVDDGSKKECQHIFSNLEAKKECEVLRHFINMGKGRALKDAFNYYLLEKSSYCQGLITVDSDGQHTVEDVIKLKNSLKRNQDSLILGVRNFNKENVPLKSSFGNKCTRTLIGLLYGTFISDTQTGLRAMPNNILVKFLDLYGERFEYETGMLLYALKNNINIVEEEIETVYYEGNKETHFNPISDSFKIYRLILGTFFKFILSSLSSAILDLAVFQLLIYILSSVNLGLQIWMATAIARLISSLYNYSVNRNLVFESKTKRKNSLIKYYILCLCQMLLSAGLVYFIVRAWSYPKLSVKLIVDLVLFFISFRIQKKFVFGENKC